VAGAFPSAQLAVPIGFVQRGLDSLTNFCDSHLSRPTVARRAGDVFMSVAKDDGELNRCARLALGISDQEQHLGPIGF